MSASSIVVVGSLNADLTLQVERHPHPGETLLAHTMSQSPGGKGANQAVAARLQGAEVAFVGAVGDDDYAAVALRMLHESGVDCAAVTTISDTSTGLAVITLDAAAENSIIVVPGANANITPAQVTAASDTITDAAVVIVQGEIPAAAIARTYQVMCESPHSTPRLVVNLAPVIDVDWEVLLAADPLVANEHEAGLLLRQLGNDTNFDDASPAAIAAALVDCGVKSVVITLGAAGAVVSHPAAGLDATHVASPKVKAVDTTGAGDAFVGALAAQLATSDDLLAAVRHAVRVAAFAVTGHGAQTSYPRQGDELPQ
ncbi:ribokinase [Corynebacterium choanae]|nr:ribokinase [Corynebacterium choanae]